MSILFSPIKLGDLDVPNRFVHSATYEAMADENGLVSENYVKRYRTLAKDGPGLIIPGYMYVQKQGRCFGLQTGIHSDATIPGLRKLADAVHGEGGKIVFQLAHGGRQTTKDLAGETPVGPSDYGRDPVNMVKPREMNVKDIQKTVSAFANATVRAVEAGADGVQLHAAHGYLLNQFLSPFFNRRKDEWGGSDDNRFRFVKEIFGAVRERMPKGMPLMIKLNTNDHTPGPGITPELAAHYAKALAEIGIDGMELSCGTSLYSFMNVCMGDLPVDDFVKAFPWWKKPVARFMLNGMVGKFDLEEGYNVNAAEIVKPKIGNVPLAVVGGFRRMRHMEDILEAGIADLISMSRPFIREPFLVKRFREGKADTVGCVSCNKCLAAVANDMPVRCYYRK